MNLVHYSDKPLRRLWSTFGQDEPFGCFVKPSGLWVSVETDNEDGWRDWCLSENFRDALICATPITLVEPYLVLTLSTVMQLQRFTREYGVTDRYGTGINWADVARDYKGIIIAPYVWSARLNIRWYYGWDCASGCFWDVSAIAISESGVNSGI